MMNRYVLIALAATLSACGSENQIRDAAQVEITAVAQGASSTGEGTKNFNRAEGELIQLEAGLANLYPLALQRCPTARSMARQWMLAALDGLMPAAQAHGGHALEAPPGVFDAVGKADGEAQALGSLGAGDGSYCGLRLALLPVSGGEIGGKSVAVGPCYYSQSAGLPAAAAALTSHECWSSQVAGGSQERVVSFAQPLAIAGTAREYHVHLTVNYNRWFDGVDMAALKAGDAQALAQLGDNLLASLEAEAEAHGD